MIALSGLALAQTIRTPPTLSTTVFPTLAMALPTRTVTGCPLATQTPVGAPSEKNEKCGAGPPPQELLDRIAELPKNLTALAKNGSANTQQLPPVIQIPTFINVVSTNASQNRYNDSFYLAQLATLNDKYNGTNFQFNLAGFQRIVNDTLAIGAKERTQNAMKRKYHNGTYTSLNLYFLSDWQPTEFNGQKLPPNNYMYGSCSFPKVIRPDVVKLDGCILQQDTLPGNTRKLEASFGYTAVHEIGHWLGLMHP
jgi:hypothetical protein